MMTNMAADHSDVLIGSGVVVAVAGPSGAGKDSVMNYAREHLDPYADEIMFVRRYITRDDTSGAEDHESLDQPRFAALREAGAFAVHWQANGLSYALPVNMDNALRKGDVVVANVSRAIIPQLRQRYAHVLPVIITAPPAVLAHRLAARGREGTGAIEARLERAEAQELAVDDAIVIVNDGELSLAGELFLATLRKAAAWSAICESV